MILRPVLVSGLIFFLSGCTALMPQAPLRISVAGLEPLEGEGMEARFAVQLRIQNHSSQPLDYNGVALDLGLRGMSFGSGVSDVHGSIPRFGEAVINVPVTVPATAILRQIFDFASGTRAKTGHRIDYQLRGLLGGPGLAPGQRFDAEGELTLPAVEPTKERQLQ